MTLKQLSHQMLTKTMKEIVLPSWHIVTAFHHVFRSLNDERRSMLISKASKQQTYLSLRWEYDTTTIRPLVKLYTAFTLTYFTANGLRPKWLQPMTGLVSWSNSRSLMSAGRNWASSVAASASASHSACSPVDRRSSVCMHACSWSTNYAGQLPGRLIVLWSTPTL